MSKIIGYVKSLNGEFKAVDADGVERVLVVGEPIYEGDNVVGDGSQNSNIIVAMESEESDITLAGNEHLLFDVSLFEEGFSDEELAFEDDDYFSTLVSDVESIKDIEVSAGTEKSDESSDDIELGFEVRNALETDVNSGLNNTTFTKVKESVEDELLGDLASPIARTQSFTEVPNYISSDPIRVETPTQRVSVSIQTTPEVNRIPADIEPQPTENFIPEDTQEEIVPLNIPEDTPPVNTPEDTPPVYTPEDTPPVNPPEDTPPVTIDNDDGYRFSLRNQKTGHAAFVHYLDLRFKKGDELVMKRTKKEVSFTLKSDSKQ